MLLVWLLAACVLVVCVLAVGCGGVRPGPADPVGADAIVAYFNERAEAVPENERAAGRYREAMDGFNDLVFKAEILDRTPGARNIVLPGDEVFPDAKRFVEDRAAMIDAIRAAALMRLAITIPTDTAAYQALRSRGLVMSEIYGKSLELRSKLRFAGELLLLDAWIAAANGDADRAAANLVAATALAEQAAAFRLEFAFLMPSNVFERWADSVAAVLSVYPELLSAEQLEPLQAACEAMETWPAVRGALRDAHLIFHAQHAPSRAVVPGDVLAEADIAAIAARPLEGTRVELHEIMTARVMEALKPSPIDTAALRRWRHESWTERLEQASAETTSERGYPIYLTGAYTNTLYWEADRRATIIGLAAHRYHLANGRFPASQAELVSAGLLEAELDAIFGPGVLGVAPHEEGVMVYDPGPDGRDNGRDDGGQRLYGVRDLIAWMNDEMGVPPGDYLLWSSARSHALRDLDGE